MSKYFCQPELEKLDIFAELELEKIREFELVETDWIRIKIDRVRSSICNII